MTAIDSLVDRALATGLVQPDRTTCGSCVLVVARMLSDPSYAEFVVHGSHPPAGATSAATLADRFRQQALATHRVTSGARSSDGGRQVPWPRALGTQPLALARELDHLDGRGGRYAVRPVLPQQRAGAFARVAALAAGGQAVPLYVGNRWSPRHVVLVLPVEEPPTRVRIYDPADGRRHPVEATAFEHARLDVAGWRVPWAMVLPA